MVTLTAVALAILGILGILALTAAVRHEQRARDHEQSAIAARTEVQALRAEALVIHALAREQAQQAQVYCLNAVMAQGAIAALHRGAASAERPA